MTVAKPRIIQLDIIRGIAILGILLMNIQSFGLIRAAYSNPIAQGELSLLNQIIWMLVHVIADQKFISIFSILFGAGILIIWEKSIQNEFNFVKLMRKRMMWLILIGMVHAYFIWYGDILVGYGIIGLIAMMFRNLNFKKLLIWGSIFFIVPLLLNMFFAWTMQFWPEASIAESASQWKPGAEIIEQELEIMKGPYWGQMSMRAETALMFQFGIFFFYTLWKCLGLMLLGMAIYKSGFLIGKVSRKTLTLVSTIGIIAGSLLILTGVMLNFQHNWSFEFSMFKGVNFNYIGSLFMALAYIAILNILAKTKATSILFTWISNIGKTALSNYLLQSIICTLLFYGHGLGLYNSLPIWQLIILVVIVWSTQILLTQIWLKGHKQGPVEWLWRRLAYGKPVTIISKD